MRLIGIYKITSPSGKVYIGQSVDITSRKNQYKRLNCKKQPKLYNSIIKYGWEAHQKDILEICPISKLNAREAFHKRKFIKEFGWEKTLFCEIKDAHTGGKRSEETKLKMSKSRLGKKDSKETKQKKSQSNLGKHSGIRPTGTGEKISKANKGKIKPNEVKKKIEKSMTLKLGKKVGCYKNNILYKKFPSLNKASREMNLSLSSINLCCQGKKYKTVGGYIFKYL